MNEQAPLINTNEMKPFPNKRIADSITTVIPILSWLPNYQWKKDLVKDVIAGFTVGIMNIPQGMAYAILGNVPPVVGLYMAFFPVLVYAVLGTSKHVSMGTFAVVTLMAGKTVAALSKPNYSNSSSIIEEPDSQAEYSPLEVAVALTFMTGVIQLLMYLLRLGVISTLLSDTLVSGLTSGAAVHVLTSQIQDILGISYKKPTGPFPIINTYIEIFKSLGTVNSMALTISLTTMIGLVINNELIKPKLSKITVIPVPVELIAVMAGTLLSRYYSLSSNYGVSIVGHIAVGLPNPELPKASLLQLVVRDSLVIAVVSYIISISMALLFSQKYEYKLDANQELLAQGAGNLCSSFFCCLPFSASLSRSVIQETAGGQTQLASIVSSSVILVVLLWIGPFFELLPRSILASLIVVALKGLLFKVKDLFRIWNMSKCDGIIWLSTYLAVILIEIDVGLLVGLMVSIVVVFLQGMKPYTCCLGRLPNTQIYVDSDRYNNTEKIPGVSVIHYAGGINFANRNYFLSAIDKIINEKSSYTTENNKIYYLVLNLSALHYVDSAGSQALLSLTKELNSVGIQVAIAGLSGPVYDTLKSCNVLENNSFTCFPTIHEAVLFAESKLKEAS